MRNSIRHNLAVLSRARRKLSVEDVHSMRGAYEAGEKIADLARKYSVNPSTVSDVVRYRKFRGVGLTYGNKPR